MEKIDLISSKKRLEKLKLQIQIADDQYYGKGLTELDDDAYDLLLQEVKRIEQTFPVLKEERSPTQRVSYSQQSLLSQQIQHQIPMLSLSNIYNENELQNWYETNQKQLSEENISLFCELKIDGLAISLIYQNGLLKQAITRGDGEVGEDVTQNVFEIKNLPKKIAHQETIILRGEIYFPKSEFEKLNQSLFNQGLEVYKNPRNAAAGAIRMKDSQEVANRNLKIIIYDIVSGEISDQHQKNLQTLKEWGFPIYNNNLNTDSCQDIINYCNKMEMQRHHFEFDIDGVVLKINDLKFRKILGFRSKSPRWAVAWKFKTEATNTQLISVENSVGRTGIITPVALLKPVNLMGTVVKRATLHNYDQIKRLNIYENDTLIITKGGEIIPKIIGIDFSKRQNDAQPLKVPTDCPICSAPLVQYKNEVDLRCPNENCVAKTIGALQHFVSKKAMDIQTLGDNQMKLFTEKGLLKNIVDIYHLQQYHDEILKIDGFGKKSVDKIFEAIESSKTVPMHKFIYALGIRYIGEKVAKTLAQICDSITDFSNLNEDKLATLEDFGDIMIDHLINWLNTEKNKRMLNDLINVGVSPQPVKKNSNQNRYTIVLTGTLSKPREEWKTILEELGFKIQTGLSKKTNYLLAGKNAGSKLKKATDFGVTILDENEFIEKFQNKNQQ